MSSPWWVVHMPAISQSTKATTQVALVHCPSSPIRGPSLCEIKHSYSWMYSLFQRSPHSSYLRWNHPAHYLPSNELDFISYQLIIKAPVGSTAHMSGSRPGPVTSFVVMDEPVLLLLVVFYTSPDAFHVCSSSVRSLKVQLEQQEC